MAFSLPVFEAHHIVEDGVDRGAEVVEKTRYIEEVLVHPTKRLKRKIKKHLLGRLTAYKNLLTLSRFLPQISLLSCSHGLQKGFLHSQHTNTGQ